MEQKQFPVDSTLDHNDVLVSPSVRFPFVGNEEINFLRQMETSTVSLGDLCDVRDGVNPGPRSFRDVILDPRGPSKPTWRHLLEGGNVQRYSISAPTRIIDYDPDLLTTNLKKRGASFREAWIFESNKIVSRQTADQLIAALDYSDSVGLNSVHFTRLKEGSGHSLWFILACLNSRIMNDYYRMRYQETRSTFPQVHISTLRKLPIPQISAVPVNEDLEATILRASEQVLTSNSGADPRQLIDVPNLHLAAKRRAQHDLISMLAKYRSREVDSNNQCVEEAIEILLHDLYGLEETS